MPADYRDRATLDHPPGFYGPADGPIAVNTLLLVVVSLWVRARGADAEQASAFVLGAEPEPTVEQTPSDAAGIYELRELLARFIGPERA